MNPWHLECIDCGGGPIENPEMGLCSSCAALRRKNERQAIKDTLKKKVALKRSYRPLAKRSVKRAEQEGRYAERREIFLKANPTCECCGSDPSIEIHHRSGRQGEKLLEEQYWMAVCRTCHNLIHDDPEFAKKNGFMLFRSIK